MEIRKVGGKVAGLLEEYGIGIPFVLAASGAACAYFAGYGLLQWNVMTAYGQFGAGVLGVLAAAFIASAGFMYATVDTTWWLRTEEEDAQTPIEVADSDGD